MSDYRSVAVYGYVLPEEVLSVKKRKPAFQHSYEFNSDFEYCPKTGQKLWVYYNDTDKYNHVYAGWSFCCTDLTISGSSKLIVGIKVCEIDCFYNSQPISTRILLEIHNVVEDRLKQMGFPIQEAESCGLVVLCEKY